MASIRESIVTQCQVGPLKFWVTKVIHGGDRRVAEYPSVGRTGADSDDLGANALRHGFAAFLDEPVYFYLFELMNEGKIQNCVHPFLGAFRGRVRNVKGELDLDDGANCTFDLVEEGDHTQVVVPGASSPAAANASARGAWSDLSAALDDLDDLDDLPESLTEAVSDLEGVWGAFDDALTAIEEGAGAWQDVASAVGDLGTAASGLLDELGAAVSDVADLVDTGITDLTYGLMDAARQAADAVSGAAQQALQLVRPKAPVSLVALVKDLLGSDSDATLARVLDLNPELIDVGLILPGTELTLPMAA